MILGKEGELQADDRKLMAPVGTQEKKTLKAGHLEYGAG